MKHLMTIAAAAILIAGCQKKDDTPVNPAAVTINILSPTSGQVVKKGDTLQLNADVSYNTELHGYELKITNDATGELLYDDDEHVHDDHFSIRSKWVDTLTQAATLKLELSVEIDHNGNEKKQELKFQSQP